MARFKTKYLLLFLIAFSIGIGAYFWRDGACLILNLYLKKLCHDKLQGSFQARRIFNENEYWIIENPHIAGHKALAEGGMDFQAEKILLTFDPHFSRRQIDLSINVIRPNLNIKQTTADIQAIVNELFPFNSYITFNTKIAVSEGTLHFHDFKQDPPSRQTLYFQIEGESKESHKGQITVSLDDPSFHNNCVSLSLNQLEEQLLTMNLDFDNVSCSTLVNAASNFIPFLRFLNVKEGSVTGQMTLNIPQEGHPFAQGDLALHNIQFHSPELEVFGSIKEACLHLNENSDNRNGHSATRGYLELAKETTLEFEKEGNPYCKITDLLGGIYFEKPDSAYIKIAGKCSHHGTVSQLQMEGNARYGKEQPGVSMDLMAQLSSPENPYAKAKFTTRSLKNGLNYAEITLEHIGSSDFDLLKMLFVPYIPQLHDTHMNKGFIDASALAYLDGFQMTEMKIEKVSAQGVHFSLFPWNLVFKIGNLNGNFSVNLKAQNIVETLNADLDITDSHLCIFGEKSNIFQLSDMQTRLTVRKGNIEKSNVVGTFAGLKGTIHFDGPSPSLGDLAHFNFKGKADELASLLPNPIEEKFKQHFSEDFLSISGGIRRTPNGVTVEGTLNVKAEMERFGQTIEYGFSLDKIPRNSSKEPSTWTVPECLLDEFPQKQGESTPSPYLTDSPLKWFRSELVTNGIALKDGWFQAQNLPLNKYVEPFLCSNNQAALSGFGDFQVSFNQDHALVNFDLRQAVIENDVITIDVKNLTADIEKDPSLPLPAAYYIDFDKQAFLGVIPVTNGSCFEKRHGLLFTDIHSLILLKNKQAHLTRLNTSCTGMHFDGKVEVDLSSTIRGVFSINTTVNKIEGHFSSFQNLASHFNDLAFLQKIPLEGELHLRQKGVHLSWILPLIITLLILISKGICPMERPRFKIQTCRLKNWKQILNSTTMPKHSV